MVAHVELAVHFLALPIWKRRYGFATTAPSSELTTARGELSTPLEFRFAVLRLRSG